MAQTVTGPEIEVVIYEGDSPRDLLMYFNEELPRESGVDDGSHGMEVGVWYGVDQEADCASSNWEEMEDGRIVPLLQRLASPDAQMVTEDGKRWELAMLEHAPGRKWRLVRRHRVGSALWRVEKSADPVTDPWMAYPPGEVDIADLLSALKLAQQALNTAQRFPVPSANTDSYEVASEVGKAIRRCADIFGRPPPSLEGRV
jgi:hypothetical protein